MSITTIYWVVTALMFIGFWPKYKDFALVAQATVLTQAVGFVVDRAVVALESADRIVGVDPDHEQVAELGGLAEVGDVAGVEDVEAAVGEDDGFTLLAVRFELAEERFGWADFAELVVVEAQQGIEAMANRVCGRTGRSGSIDRLP